MRRSGHVPESSPSNALRFSSAAFFSSYQACRWGEALPPEPVEVPDKGIMLGTRELFCLGVCNLTFGKSNEFCAYATFDCQAVDWTDHIYLNLRRPSRCAMLTITYK